MFKKTLSLAFVILAILILGISVSAAEYQYDELNRLICVTYDNVQSVRYTYDAGGNITSVIFTTGQTDLGDVNGDGLINVSDVILVMRHALQITTLNQNQQMVADVNKDGLINVSDAILIMQYILNIIDKF